MRSGPANDYRWRAFTNRRLARRLVGIAFASMLGGIWWLLPTSKAAAELQSLTTARNESTASVGVDCQRTIVARQTLLLDEELRRVNVGVMVRGNVATMWGGIPSADLARRAEERLRQVPGVARINNELRVEAAGEPKKNLFVQPSAPSLPQEGLLTKTSLVSGSLMVKPAEIRAEPKAGLLVRPGDYRPADAVHMMPPLVVTFRPPPLPEPPPLPSGKTIALPANVNAALHRLQMSEGRFRQIHLELKAGVVVLRGTVQRPEDMIEFAQAVSRIPGVERIIVGEYRTPQKGSLQLP